MRHFLSIPDFSSKELESLLALAESMRAGQYDARPLKGPKDVGRHRRVERRHEGVQRPVHGQREAPLPRVVRQAIPRNRACFTGHYQVRVRHPP